MSTFIRSQVSSVISAFFDFLTTIVCKEFFYFWVVFASLARTLVGDVTNFTLSGFWVFKKREKKMPLQVLKYILIWNGNLALSTLGVFIVTHYIGANYIVAKIALAVAIGVSYNCLLQKKFVFA